MAGEEKKEGNENEEILNENNGEASGVGDDLSSYLEQVCVGHVNVWNDPIPKLEGMLRTEIGKKLGGIAENMSPEMEKLILGDIMVMDIQKEQFVRLSELSEPLEYIQQHIRKNNGPTLGLVAEMVKDGFNFLVPKYNEKGGLDTGDPILIGGGQEGDEFYLRVDDRESQAIHEQVPCNIQKPDFLDRFVDFFKRLVGLRDPICEVWDRFEPFRKMEDVFTKSMVPGEKARSIEEDLEEVEIQAQEEIQQMEDDVQELEGNAQTSEENRQLEEEQRRLEQKKESLENVKKQETELADASKDALSQDGREVVGSLHAKIGQHMRGLVEKGFNNNLQVRTADEEWGVLPNLRGAPGSDVSAYSLFGMAVAFGLLNERLNGGPMNHVVLRALVTGEYEAIGGREGKYGEVISDFESIMSGLHEQKIRGAGMLDDANYHEDAERLNQVVGKRNYYLNAGVYQMQMELLRQADPASPWAMELGRMLECAEAVSQYDYNTNRNISFYAAERFGNLSFAMRMETKALCDKQHEVENGIGAKVGSEEYEKAQAAVEQLRTAAENCDFYGLMSETNSIDMIERRHKDLNEQRCKEYQKLSTAISTNATEEYEYGVVPENQWENLDSTPRGISAQQNTVLAYNQHFLIAVSFALAGEYGLSGDDVRRFISGEEMDDFEKYQTFKNDVQNVLNTKNNPKGFRDYFIKGAQAAEKELYQQKDMNSPWSHLLGQVVKSTFKDVRNSTLFAFAIGRISLQNPVLTETEEINKSLVQFMEQCSPHEVETPTEFMKSNPLKDVDKENTKKAYTDYLKNMVKRGLAERFMVQVSGMDTPEDRQKFVENNGKLFKGLTVLAEQHVDNHIDEYLTSPEAFKKAALGGALHGFNKSMQKGKEDVHEENFMKENLVKDTPMTKNKDGKQILNRGF